MPPGSQVLTDLLPTGRPSWTVFVVAAIAAVIVLVVRDRAEHAIRNDNGLPSAPSSEA